MLPAQQIFARDFDAAYFRLPVGVRQRIQRKIDEISIRLASYSHERLQGCAEFRFRVGDYRVTYTFDIAANVIHLLRVGHRREIYRSL